MNAWNAEKPYNHLPDLPPITDLESKEILKKCIVARAALAGLKQAAERIPNQNMLINTLPVMEAQASSEIENIVTTLRLPTNSFNPCNWKTPPTPLSKKPCNTAQPYLQVWHHWRVCLCVLKPPCWCAVKSKADRWIFAR